MIRKLFAFGLAVVLALMPVQAFGKTVSSLRMDKAKELLRCTSKRSSEIAGEVGYRDAHYFSYLFKKTQGMTPSEYRKTRGEV